MRCKDEKKNYFGEFASSQLVKQSYRRWFLRAKKWKIFPFSTSTTFH